MVGLLSTTPLISLQSLGFNVTFRPVLFLFSKFPNVSFFLTKLYTVLRDILYNTANLDAEVQVLSLETISARCPPDSCFVFAILQIKCLVLSFNLTVNNYSININ